MRPASRLHVLANAGLWEGFMTTQDSRRHAVLRRAYEAFNQRDLEAALALMDPDVEWPNVLQATTLQGRDAVRAYWLDQFETIDPRAEPEAFEPLGEDEVVVMVHQVVRDRGGTVLADVRLAHGYVFRGDRVARMAIYPTLDAARRAASLHHGQR
jgi:ketosteroid isomerase-like protein